MALFGSRPRILRDPPLLDAAQPAEARTATFALG